MNNQTYSNLQTFFQRSKFQQEVTEATPPGSSTDFVLPILPLARYETVPSAGGKQEEDEDLMKPSPNQQLPEQDESEKTTCNACMMM